MLVLLILVMIENVIMGMLPYLINSVMSGPVNCSVNYFHFIVNYKMQ